MKLFSSFLCTCDHRPLGTILNTCRYITRASGRGLGPGTVDIESFLGPVKWHRAIKYIFALQDRSRGAEAAAGLAEAGEHLGPRRVAQSCQGDDSSLHPTAQLD